MLEWEPFPSPGHLPNPGIKPGFPALQADSLSSEPPERPLACFYLYLFGMLNLITQPRCNHIKIAGIALTL